MQALWGIERGFVKDVLEAFQRPKGQGRSPAYTTVSTIIRILEQKGFVGHEAFGRAHRYFPKVSKEAYRTHTLERMKKDYFKGSAQSLLSHFIEKEDLSVTELDALLKLINERKQGDR